MKKKIFWFKEINFLKHGVFFKITQKKKTLLIIIVFVF